MMRGVPGVRETVPEGGRVFLVDDDASVRRALTRLLKAGGLDVESFPSADALLAAERSARDARRGQQCRAGELVDGERRPVAGREKQAATDLYCDGDEITGDWQRQAGRSDVGLGRRGRCDFAKTAQKKERCYHEAAEGRGVVVGHGTLH
jgi:CheY-like chemotaxis protein